MGRHFRDPLWTVLAQSVDSAPERVRPLSLIERTVIHQVQKEIEEATARVEGGPFH